MTAAREPSAKAGSPADLSAKALATAEARQGEGGFTAELPAEVFAGAMARIAPLTARPSSIPIVTHALLRFGKKTALTLAATNLDQALAVTVKAKGAGAITASAARLAAIAERLEPGGPVKLHLAEDGRLVVSQGRSSWRLPTLPAADFPANLVEPLAGAIAWQVPAEILIAQLKAVEGAVSEDDARSYLCGFFFDLSRRSPADPSAEASAQAEAPHRPALVGAQGARLAAVELSTLADGALAPPDGAPCLLLPPGALRPLADLARTHPDLALGLTENGVTAAAEGLFFRTKLIEGAKLFPDWRRIVPPAEGEAALALKVRVQAAVFRRAIERASLIEADPEGGGKAKSRVSALRLAFGAEEIAITNRNALGEEAADACPLEWLALPARPKPPQRGEGPPEAPPAEDNGEEIIQILNARHLLWALTSLGDLEDVDIAFGRGLRPMVLTAAGDPARASLRVISPLRG